MPVTPGALPPELTAAAHPSPCRCWCASRPTSSPERPTKRNPQLYPQGINIDSMATDVAAHITGTVWEIKVNVGDSVTEGQALLVLESMKMEMPVESPADGKVSKIAVAKGQAVEEGEVLLTLD